MSRSRSTRSRVVEVALAVAAVVAIWIFVASGGATWAGEQLAGLFTSP